MQTLAGHGGEVNCVAFSPDGALVATVDEAGMVRIWRVDTGQVLHAMQAHRGQAFGVAFSPSGECLATCGEDELAILWNTKDWGKITELVAHSQLVGSLSFSPDGKLLATASDDDNIVLWDLATRKDVRRLLHDGPIGSVRFDHSGTRFLGAARSTRQAWLWRGLGTLQGTTASFSQVVHAIGFDQTDQRFAVGTKDGTVELLDTNTLKVAASVSRASRSRLVPGLCARRAAPGHGGR